MESRILVFALVSLLCVTAVSGEEDHDRARRALAAGEIVPLSTILEKVERSFDGRVIEVELEREGGRWVYEIELVTPRGNVIELSYDAATKRLLETEGAGVDAARRKK